ncbi:MAG: hypothetical protein HY319_01370 [Armatimonadetes bacterium]|nr:hypothetical protein [Armatimonadota bacterium]
MRIHRFSQSLPPRTAVSNPPEQPELPGFPADEDMAKIRNLTVAGAVVGSLAVGLGTMPLMGPTETLVGMACGSISAAAAGAGAGAILSTSILSDPGHQGRIGLALVGGALGGVLGLGLGLFAGAYIGNSGYNALGFAGGAVAGAAAGYLAGRLSTAG